MDFIDLITQKNRIKNDLMISIESIIDRAQFILGPEVAELEGKLAEFTNTKHCVGNANGTDALVLALRALNIGKNDEVIVPAFTFFATAEAVSLVGATPVFVDIDRATYNINPKLIENAITKNTKAIIPVCLYGVCADFDSIGHIANKHNLAVIEDAAQSFGAVYKSKRSGSLSTIACTSFFPSKPLGAYGDGGACFTNDDSLAIKLKELRTHGQEKRYTHTSIGYNSRLDTLQAAILLKKLEIFPSEIDSRNMIAKNYINAFEGKFKMQSIPQGQTSVFAQFTIEVANRTEFQSALNEMGIPTAVHYPIPLHLQPVYKHDYANITLKESEEASQRVVSIPMHPYLESSSQNFIIENVLKFGKI